MRILITGATGLVGTRLVALCHQKDIEVNYLTTRRSQVRSEEHYRGFYWDPDTGEIDPECLTGVSAIVNLAGSAFARRWTRGTKKKILSSRINSLRTLSDALGSSGNENIRCLVSASAIGIYPDSLSEYYTEEESLADGGFVGEVVAAWEKEARQLARYGFPVASIRVGLVLAREGGFLPKLALPVKYGLGAAFGSGEQWQSWIHIKDLARMILFIIKYQCQGIINGVAPNPVTQTKLLRELACVLKRPLWLPNIPKSFMNLALGEMADILYSSQRVSSRKIEDMGFTFDYPNIGRALTAIYPSENGAASAEKMSIY